MTGLRILQKFVSVSILFLHKSGYSYLYFDQKQSAMLLDIPKWYLLSYYYYYYYIILIINTLFVAQVQFSKLLFFYRYLPVAANELEVLLIQRK